MAKSIQAAKEQVLGWLRTGMSPRRLALTLALGFALGCLPVFGVPTGLCIVLALLLRLNLPVIQAANYAAMPLQLLLVLPFARMGGWMLATGAQPAATPASLLHASGWGMLTTTGALAGQAVAGWLVTAVPMVALLTVALTFVLRRMPLPAQN